MSMKKTIILILLILLIVLGIYKLNLFKISNNVNTISNSSNQTLSGAFDKSKMKTDEEWKKILKPDEYYILRQKGTEVPFSGILDSEQRKGTYYSVGCNAPLFRSEQKFDSGTGWPSFWAPITNKSVVLENDVSVPTEERIEVLDTCGNHLGHVFDEDQLQRENDIA